jgi:Domain of unknown function (DUF1924)
MKLRLAPFLLCAGTVFAVRAEVVADLLKQYQGQGASTFNAATAEAMWTKPFTDAKTGEARRCSTCHTEDLRRVGKHATTGKAIEPLAPSANPQRLTEAEKIEKWLSRNCKWVLSRECSPQEKGDFLVMIRSK